MSRTNQLTDGRSDGGMEGQRDGQRDKVVRLVAVYLVNYKDDIKISSIFLHCQYGWIGTPGVNWDIG